MQRDPAPSVSDEIELIFFAHVPGQPLAVESVRYDAHITRIDVGFFRPQLDDKADRVTGIQVGGRPPVAIKDIEPDDPWPWCTLPLGYAALEFEFRGYPGLRGAHLVDQLFAYLVR